MKMAFGNEDDDDVDAQNNMNNTITDENDEI